MNPLRAWFEQHHTGPGVWKWDHYLDEVYHRHLEKFRGKEVHVVEVGVYSGGSLQMWRDYFGPQCFVTGVDIQPACLKFANDEWCSIAIGDQGSRSFWRSFKATHPRVDILIDDGGHAPEQQLVTLEEMLPHLAPGGVYCTEDILLDRNDAFAAHLGNLSMQLHTNVDIQAPDMLAMGLTPFQRLVHSIHIYPHIAMIERWDTPPVRFQAPARGDQWIHFDPAWKP